MSQRGYSESHQDHIVDKGYQSLCHYGLVRTPVPLLKVMKIPVTTATDKEWDQLKKAASLGRRQSSRQGRRNPRSSEQKDTSTFRHFDVGVGRTPTNM